MNKLFNVFAWVHHISPMSQPSKGDKCLLLLVVIIIKIYRHTLFKIMKSVWCLIFMSRDDTHCCGWCKLIGVPSILIFFGLWQYNVTMVVLWARLQIERSILPMLQLSTLSLSLPPYLPPSASSVHFRVMPSYADGAAQLPRSSQQNFSLQQSQINELQSQSVSCLGVWPLNRGLSFVKNFNFMFDWKVRSAVMKTSLERVKWRSK